MTKVKFKRDKTGWYHTETDLLRYTIKNVAPRTWFIYETQLGKNFGTHIATAHRVHDAKAWVTDRVLSETLLK